MILTATRIGTSPVGISVVLVIPNDEDVDMRLEPYRRVLALPGIRSLTVLGLLARIPITAVAVTLTLHVVLDLHRGYGAAGLVGAALTVGAALGAPLNGRFIDLRGLRPMLAVTTTVEAAFWLFAPAMSYPVLLGAALVTGLFSLPVFSVVRQSIAALVPEGQRRQAYALDSMSVELSFMAGPTFAVLLVTQASATVAMVAVGVMIVLAGNALFVTNPPVRPAVEHGEEAAPTPRRGDWLTLQFLLVLAAAMATTMVLAGTDVAIVAVLRQAHQVAWTGVVVAIWGAYSMVGGFVYGALTRAVPLIALLGLLSILTVPVGLSGAVPGGWVWLFIALLPAGVLCAPALTSTSDAVSRLVPAGARGEAMGWHGSALTVGLAIGAPMAGAAIDAGSPAWGFAAVGAAGALVTVLLLPIRRRLTHGTAAEVVQHSPDATPEQTERARPAAEQTERTRPAPEQARNTRHAPKQATNTRPAAELTKSS
jgi:MFS family permease